MLLLHSYCRPGSSSRSQATPWQGRGAGFSGLWRMRLLYPSATPLVYHWWVRAGSQKCERAGSPDTRGGTWGDYHHLTPLLGVWEAIDKGTAVGLVEDGETSEKPESVANRGARPHRTSHRHAVRQFPPRHDAVHHLLQLHLASSRPRKLLYIISFNRSRVRRPRRIFDNTGCKPRKRTTKVDHTFTAHYVDHAFRVHLVDFRSFNHLLGTACPPSRCSPPCRLHLHNQPCRLSLLQVIALHPRQVAAAHTKPCRPPLHSPPCRLSLLQAVVQHLLQVAALVSDATAFSKIPGHSWKTTWLMPFSDWLARSLMMGEEDLGERMDRLVDASDNGYCVGWIICLWD